MNAPYSALGMGAIIIISDRVQHWPMMRLNVAIGLLLDRSPLLLIRTTDVGIRR